MNDGSGCHELLASTLVQTLLQTHPNDIVSADPGVHFVIPEAWEDWWDWAGREPLAWVQLVRRYQGHTEDLPISLERLISRIRRVQLPRDAIEINAWPLSPKTLATGMSPKKTHEVTRMVTYIADLLDKNDLDTDALIVDVGAGQGYLTRALKARLQTVRILALDADIAQSDGARNWEKRLIPNLLPHITHRTVLISPDSLIKAVDEWVADITLESPPSEPIPVVFIGLHACGSLTPDIVKVVLERRRRSWRTAAAVIVGCCYNLMREPDYPLAPSSPPLTLPTSAFHLAAQVPTHWLSPDGITPLPDVSLSVRKVTWRALLTCYVTPNLRDIQHIKDSRPLIQPPARWSRHPPSSISAKLGGTGTQNALQRLGRLRDAAYSDWSTFFSTAQERMNILPSKQPHAHPFDVSLERRLEVLHVLRCLVGPVVESAILIDRLAWVRDALSMSSAIEENQPMHVQLVNLFNQASGSGRNVAIVLGTQLP